MSGREPRKASSGKYHFLGIVLVTLLVMVLGVLVVAAPERMGVPQFAATPAATPIATTTP